MADQEFEIVVRSRDAGFRERVRVTELPQGGLMYLLVYGRIKCAGFSTVRDAVGAAVARAMLAAGMDPPPATPGNLRAAPRAEHMALHRPARGRGKR